MSSYQGHASVAFPRWALVTWAVVVNGAILVNREGERFGCETVGYSEYAGAVMAQPGGQAWEIFDEEVYEASLGTRFDEVVEAGKVHRFENLEELAETFGLPAGTLEATVELTNRSARGLAPDPFGRDAFSGGPLEPPSTASTCAGAVPHPGRIEGG